MRRVILGGCGFMCAAMLAGCGVTGGGGAAVKSDEVLDKAVAILQEGFKAADPAVRANCVEGMQTLADPRSTAMIGAALSDPEWVVRFAGAMAAGRRRLGEFRDRLTTMMRSDPNGSVRVAAVYALRRMGSPVDDAALRTALADPDPAVRANAALVYGLLGDASAIPLLKAREREDDTRVRWEITAALARLGDNDAQKIVMAQALSKYGEDEWLAMDVCGDLPQAVSGGVLINGLTPAPPGIPEDVRKLTEIRQMIAARSLAKQGSQEGAEAARQGLYFGPPEVKALAAMALGEVLSPLGAKQRLAPLLVDEDARVRRAGAAAVVRAYARAAG